MSRSGRALLVLALGVVVLPLATAAAVGDGPRIHGVRGRTTLIYRRPFITCPGAGGQPYRQVLRWIGRGTLHSTDRFLDGQKVVDNVNFLQNASTGTGVVSGSFKTYRVTRSGPRLRTFGTFVGVWHNRQGRGQIVLRRVGRRPRSLFILNAALRLRSVAAGTAVDIVFGRRASFGAAANASAFFDGRPCR